MGSRVPFVLPPPIILSQFEEFAEPERIDPNERVLNMVCSRAKRTKLDIKFTHSSANRRNVDKHIVRIISTYAKESMRAIEEIMRLKALSLPEKEVVYGFIEGIKNLDRKRRKEKKGEKLYAKIICGMIAHKVLREILVSALLKEEERMKDGFFGKISANNIDVYRTTIAEYRQYLTEPISKRESLSPSPTNRS
jgi:hypothetical protein